LIQFDQFLDSIQQLQYSDSKILTTTNFYSTLNWFCDVTVIVLTNCILHSRDSLHLREQQLCQLVFCRN